MADGRRRGGYMSDGSAAYDLGALRDSAAPRLERPPEEQPRPRSRPQTRPKAKAMVSPFAVLGAMFAGFLAILVIFGYVRLYEATAEVGRLNAKLSSIKQDNEGLRSQYEGRIDLAAIEQRAIHELGMTQPSTNQNIYLNLAGVDRAEIVEEEDTGFFATLFEACTTGVQELADYLRHKPAK